MPVKSKSKESQALRKLIPFTTMPAQQFDQLASGITVQDAAPDSFLFKRGDATKAFIYLIEGTVSLEADELKIETISADTDAAKFALAHQFPRKISARAVDNVRYVSLNLNIFDQQDTEYEEKESIYMVENDDLEMDEADDWMSVLLKSPIFQRLPAMNLQQVLINLEEVNYKKGEVIFHQGDQGDYYYLVRKGRCALSRKASERAKEIKLLELGTHETFGEDSLLSGETRSMTITAVTNMVVSRIDKERFTKLIEEPALKYIDYAGLQDAQAQNHALVLDIRPTDLYLQGHLKDSKNVPFFSLRMNVKDLKNESKIIVVCEDGQLSKAAAFFLIKNRIDALILTGGMQNISEDQLNGRQASFTIDESEPPESESVLTQADMPAINIEELPAEITIEKHATDIQLQQENKNLKAENQRITTELETLKKQYRMLYKQTEKLKSVLDKFQASKEEK